MDKKQLMQMADKYQAKADKAEQAYQETGISRYDNERRKSEDLAEALRNAANAADDRNKLIAMRSEVAALAASASRAMDNCERCEEALERVAKEVVAVAQMFGLAWS